MQRIPGLTWISSELTFEKLWPSRRYIVVGFPMMPGASKEMTPLGHHIIWSIQGGHRDFRLFFMYYLILLYFLRIPHFSSVTSLKSIRCLMFLPWHFLSISSGLPQSGVPLTFCMWDEEYSTSEAKAAIKSVSGKRSVVLKHKDAMAASIILRNFLHSNQFWIHYSRG